MQHILLLACTNNFSFQSLAHSLASLNNANNRQLRNFENFISLICLYIEFYLHILCFLLYNIFFFAFLCLFQYYYYFLFCALCFNYTHVDEERVRERERVKMAFSMKTRNDKVDETDSMQIILPFFFTIFHSFPFLLQQTLFFCFLIKMSIFIIIIFLQYIPWAGICINFYNVFRESECAHRICCRVAIHDSVMCWISSVFILLLKSMYCSKVNGCLVIMPCNYFAVKKGNC
ncbi:hypothetical protein ACKWTF_003513 [Chironomus riparius]